MASYQPSSQSTNSTLTVDNISLASNLVNNKSKAFVSEPHTTQTAAYDGAPEGFIGHLDVFIHQACNIHNICIYHKQDVYAKLSMTSNPEVAVESQTIKSGGRNPVFNENLQLSIRMFDASLRFEIWMRSAAPHHLEDQLLGFVSIPLSDIFLANGKLEKEFSLSANDLFHSAAGFVQLSISYVGSYPEVMAIVPPPATIFSDTSLPDSENDDSITSKLAKIEFLDWKVMNENNRMVSELFGIPCTEMDSQPTESLVVSEGVECPNNELAGIRFVESFSADNSLIDTSSNRTPVSSVSVNGSPASLPATSPSSSDPMLATASPTQKERAIEAAEGEADSSLANSDDTVMEPPPLINISIEPEQTVMPQDIVDKYMKAMQESLASMKLPMDIESSSSSSSSNNNNNNKENGNSTSDQKLPATMKAGSRVFYGSRAFF